MICRYTRTDIVCMIVQLYVHVDRGEDMYEYAGRRVQQRPSMLTALRSAALSPLLLSVAETHETRTGL